MSREWSDTYLYVSTGLERSGLFFSVCIFYAHHQVKDPSQASFVNLLRAGRQRTVDIDEEEEAVDDDEVNEVKEDQAKTTGTGVKSADGSRAEQAKPRMVRKAVVRPMPLVLAG